MSPDLDFASAREEDFRHSAEKYCPEYTATTKARLSETIFKARLSEARRNRVPQPPSSDACRADIQKPPSAGVALTAGRPGEWLSQLEVWGRPSGCNEHTGWPEEAAGAWAGELDPFHDDWYAW